MKIIVALLIAALLVVPGAAVANDGKDELIAAQENLLDAYRCLLSLDLELVEQGCPNKFQGPTFLPTPWNYIGLEDIRLSHFGLVTYGSYFPATRYGSSLFLECQGGLIVPKVDLPGQELVIRTPTIQVSYTAGDNTDSRLWVARISNSTVSASHPAPIDEEFLDHLRAADGGILELTATDANGRTVTTQYSLTWAKWAVDWMRLRCNVELLGAG